MKTDYIEEVECVDIPSEQNQNGDCMFQNGDIIVNDDFSIIGVFFQELQDKDEQITFPTFHVACSCGKVYENYDDLNCDWPEDYRFATDEEIEIFLKEVEDLEGLVWNPEEYRLEKRDEENWKIKGHFYPKTWNEAVDNYTACQQLENELFCCGYEDEFAGKMITLAQLKLLYDIFNEGNENKYNEVSYAVIVAPCGEIECRPYIYGLRNSLLSFRYQSQARLFMTYFEDMIKKCKELV